MSGDSSAKITVDADTRSVEAGAQKVQRGFRQAAHEAHGIGDQLEHVGKHIANHIIGVRALVRIIENAGEAMHKYQEEAKKASDSLGAGIVSRAESGGRLGLTGAQTSALTAPGFHSRKEGDAFLGQIAAMNTGRTRISTTDVVKATNLFRSGLFSQSEITEALHEGRLDELGEKQRERAELAGPEFEEESRTRTQVNQLEDQAEEAAANPAYRIGDARVKVRDARSPVAGAVAGVIKGLPVIGSVFSAEESEVAAGTEAGKNIDKWARDSADRMPFTKSVFEMLKRSAEAGERSADNTAPRAKLASGGTE